MAASSREARADLTLAEAAAYLDPPVTRDQLAALVSALPGIVPVGTRRRYPGGPGGRPPATYDADQILELHAAVARWL